MVCICRWTNSSSTPIISQWRSACTRTPWARKSSSRADDPIQHVQDWQVSSGEALACCQQPHIQWWTQWNVGIMFRTLLNRMLITWFWFEIIKRTAGWNLSLQNSLENIVSILRIHRVVININWLRIGCQWYPFQMDKILKMTIFLLGYYPNRSWKKKQVENLMSKSMIVRPVKFKTICD